MTDQNSANVLLYFEEEINQIKSSTIADYVFEIFNKLCPNYFWDCPASTSGKYHPKISLGKHGLIRHTKLAVWWAKELLRSSNHNFSQIHLDCAIATLLVHDIIKNGDAEIIDGEIVKEKDATKCHGFWLAEKIRKEVWDGSVEDDLLDCEQSLIYWGVRNHMGKWGYGEEVYPYHPPENIQHFVVLVHLADYCASRKVDEEYEKILQEIPD